jgi:hypothetical protein
LAPNVDAPNYFVDEGDYNAVKTVIWRNNKL